MTKDDALELDMIQDLLLEADSYGLRAEVMESFKKFKEEYPEHTDYVLYQWAFNEWVK